MSWLGISGLGLMGQNVAATSGGGVVAAPTSTFTMTQLASANRVYQRSTTTGGGQSKGQGTVPVTISSASAGTVNARCRASDGSTIIQAEWAAATIAGGATTANISGVDARLGWFFLDLKDSSGTWKNGTTLVGMGRLIGVSGQSLATRMFNNANVDTTNTNASQSITIDPNGVVYGKGDGNPSSPTWALPADGSYTTTYNSCFASEFLRLQVAASGVNCAQVGTAVGSTSITDWIGAGTQVAGLHTILQAAGGYEAFIWMQGHSDSLAGMSSATYQGNLDTLFADLTTQNSVRGSSYDKYLASIPNTTNIISWGTAAQINTIRQAQAAWAAANSATALQPADLALADGVHENQIGARTLARHFYRATRPALGLSHNDTGPTITSVTRTAGSAVIKLNLSLPSGATALSTVGSPATRFLVASTGDNNVRPITTFTAVSGTEIDLTLTQTPADNAPLDIWFGCPPSPVNDGGADMVYDNNTDSDGLTTGRQLGVTVSAVAGAAPTASLGPTLTSVSATFGASSETAFGQCLTGGYGKSAAILADDVLPWVSTLTAECRFKISAIPGSTKVMFGAANLLYIGVAPTTGFLTGNLTADGTTNVCDGNWHHVAVVSNGASGVKVYLDGVQHMTTASKYTPASSSTGHFDIGTFLDSGAGGFQWTGSINEVATWTTAKYTGTFTPPTAPYVGNEAGLYALYHLDGNLNSG